MTAATYSVFGRAALGRSAQTWAANSLPRWAYNVAPTDPLAAKGKTIFEAQSCHACHGYGGGGAAAAPAPWPTGGKSTPPPCPRRFAVRPPHRTTRQTPR